jgi:hypothetical protein
MNRRYEDHFWQANRGEMPWWIGVGIALALLLLGQY